MVSNTSCGGRLSSTNTSVAVTGICLPVDLRILRHSFLTAVTPVLTPDNVRRRKWPHGSEGPLLLVTQSIRVLTERCTHREQGDDLQQVVLNDITDCPQLLVKGPAPRDTEALSHRDLHTLDIGTVPNRLKEGIGEAEVQQILDRFFAKVVVDSEYCRFGKRLKQHLVERPCRGKIAAERLFDDQPRPLAGFCIGQPFSHARERVWRYRQVVKRTRSRAQRLTELAECLR